MLSCRRLPEELRQPAGESIYLKKVMPEVATPPADEVTVTKFGGGTLLKVML